MERTRVNSRGPQGPAGDGGDGSGTQGPQGPPGKDGEDGKDGLSAYELWKIEVEKGLENPHDPGNNWPKDQTDMDDFWEYLRGEDGKDGQDGEDGESIVVQEPVKGSYNVIAMYAANGQEAQEYVDWANGKVQYVVYDTELKELSGATVTMTFGETTKTYTSGDGGIFYVDNTDLPFRENDPINSLQSVTLQVNGTTHSDLPKNTYIPSQIQVRLRLNIEDGEIKAPRFRYDDTPEAWLIQPLAIDCIFERKEDEDSDWEIMPQGFEAEMQATIYSYDNANGIMTERGKTEETFDFSTHNADRPINIEIPRKAISSKDSNFDMEKASTTEIENEDGEKVDLSDSYWGEYNESEKRYVTIGFDGTDDKGCYGQKVMLQTTDATPKTIIMQDVPAQPMPIPDRMVAYNFLQDAQQNLHASHVQIYLNNPITNQLYEELIFNRYYVVDESATPDEYLYYIPEKQDNIEDLKVYHVMFSGGGQTVTTNEYPLNHTEAIVLKGTTANVISGMTMYLLPMDAEDATYNFIGYPCGVFTLSGSFENPTASLTSSHSEIVKTVPTITTNTTTGGGSTE